jgi:hypothetical protein
MKTATTLALIAAFVAFVVYQFSFQVSVSLLFAAGLVTIVAADYRRTLPPMVSSRKLVASRHAERLPLAS